MKKLLIPALLFCACAGLLLAGTGLAITATMPPYRDSIGGDNHTEKITGLYLIRASAARENNLIIYGSSELRTRDISTHPANFFADERSGFQVNLVGRGSCQSLIHALSIAASGGALTGQKVVLITSPQSYVPQGIAPDQFMANFSPQQYLELLGADDLSDEVKQAISSRVAELIDAYEALPDSTAVDPALKYLAGHHSDPGLLSSARNMALTPYYGVSRYLYDLRDKTSARTLLLSAGPDAAYVPFPEGIDWESEAAAAGAEARRLATNNDFGMINDYYTTYIGSRLARYENRDADLDYAQSKEYDDLRILFEVCRQKGTRPLFIHVPLHGAWSDYTGFTVERRQQYYQHVRDIAESYDIAMLDLTGYEYEDYFLCDVMHLGWKGWLAVDKALIDYYNGL